MTRAVPFDHKALQRIHEITRGVPRRINLLCDRVMLGAYAHGRHSIDIPMIEKAGREVFGRPTAEVPDRNRFGSMAGIGLVAGGVALAALIGFALYGGWRQLAAPTSLAAASPPRRRRRPRARRKRRRPEHRHPPPPCRGPPARRARRAR
jgi:general secretion pathway protein A